jgi:hypothetical protein
MNAGDKFIRYSKNGAVVGEIEKITSTFQYDLKNKVQIEKKKIHSTKGVIYDYEECYLVVRELKIGFCIKLKLFLERLRNKK